MDTLKRKSSGDTAVVIGVLIDKIGRGVSFYVRLEYCKNRMIIKDHGNVRCERHKCVNCSTYFLVRIGFVDSATGRSMWLTSFGHD